MLLSEIKKNLKYTVTIEGYTHEGDGVAHVDGRVFFVKGALLGETLEVRVLKDSRNIVYAKIEKILTASTSRTEPSCPNFGKCGGCDLLHMNYSEELSMKRRRVEDALKRIGGLDVIVTGIVGASSIENYRNKAIYAVGKSEGRAVTGFYRERSHDIVPTESCLIQADVSDRAAAAVRRWMDRFFVTAYNEELRSGVVRHVFCRYAFCHKKSAGDYRLLREGTAASRGAHRRDTKVMPGNGRYRPECQQDAGQYRPRRRIQDALG